nr:tetratricopeptide repeat protein [uncultured Arsenicibacter sp.]
MLTRRLVFLLFLFHASPLLAQIDREKLAHMPPEEKLPFMNSYLTQHWWEFYDSIRQPDRQAARLSEYRFMRSAAKDPQTLSLLRLFWCRNQQAVSFYAGRNAQGLLDSLTAIREYAHRHNLLPEEGICWLAWCKAIIEHQGNMDERHRRILVYDGAVRGMSLLAGLPLAVVNKYHGATYDIIHHIWWMSMYFARIEEYDLARRAAVLGNRWAHPGLDTHDGHPYGYNYYKWQFLNDLGSCYLHMNNLGRAAYWYRKAHTFGLSYGSTVHSSISYGNLGVVLIRQGKHAAAIPYLKQAIAAVRRGNDRQSEFNATLPLAEAYLALKQYDNAWPVLVRSIALYDSVQAFINQTDSLDLIPAYGGLGEVYQYRGDLKQALFYTRLASRLEEKRRLNDDARIFRRKQEKLEAEVYRAKLDQIETDRLAEVWLRNGALSGMVLVGLISLVYIAYQRRRRQQAEAQLALIASEARRRTEELDLLRRLTEAPAGLNPLPAVSRIQELTRQSILTDADWDRFRQSFERVYPDYILRLRATYPTLTPAEIRLICLSRLDLSTKETASMLGVSTDTVIKTRYRIRRKANLPEGADLNGSFGSI